MLRRQYSSSAVFEVPLLHLVGDRSSSGSFSDDAVQVRDLCHSRTPVWGSDIGSQGVPIIRDPRRWSMSCNWLHSRTAGI